MSVRCFSWLLIALTPGATLADSRRRHVDPGEATGTSAAVVLEDVAGINEIGPAEVGHGLTPKEAGDGWISLFDGKTGWGWEGARVEAGVLSGAATTTSFGACVLRAQVERAGSLVVGGAKLKISPGVFSYASRAGHGPIRLEDGAAVRALELMPHGLEVILGGKELAGWKRIDHPKLADKRRARWDFADGILHAVGGPGAMEYQKRQYGDLVLQAEVRTRGRHVNGGLFFRSVPGDFMNGYEAQIYNRCEAGDVARPSLWSTGAIDDRQNARRLVSRDGDSFLMTVIAQGNHLATWVNGFQQVDWRDTRPRDPNPRRGLRTEPGTIQLQAHDPDTDLEFRMIRVRGD